MRIPVDKEFLEKAKAEGLPLFRLQIDWKYVPKEQRHLRSHEACGYITLETARALLRLSLADFIDLSKESTEVSL